MEKIIEWQDLSWVFLGDRPQTPGQCFRHFGLVTGMSAKALARDRHGKSTLRLVNNSLPTAQNKNRKLKLMAKYVDVMYDNAKRIGTGNTRCLPTRAAEEPPAMLEMLVSKCLKNDDTGFEGMSNDRSAEKTSQGQQIHPLRMLSIFKHCLQSDQSILRFDLLTLNQQCVELLRKIQIVCLEQSPMCYP